MSVELLTDTESFFDRQTSSGFAIPGAIVVVTAVIALVNDLYVVGWLFSDTEMSLLLIYAFSGPIAVAIPLLVWVLMTASFHGIATVVYESDASFKRLLRLTGYGMAPYAVGSLVSMVMTILVLNDLAAPTSMAETTEAQQLLENDTRFLAAGYLFLGFLVWCGDLWATAVQTVHDVSQKRALVIVAGPVAVLLVVMWYITVGL